MSDNIIEITETSQYTITVDTSLIANDNNVSIQLDSPNTVEIIDNNIVLLNDIPPGYPIGYTTGDLPITRVSGIVGESGIYYDNGIIGISGIPYDLITVHDIISSSGLSVTNNSGIFTIAVTGTFGLTSEQVDDRVNDLLKAGSYVNLNYDDNNNNLTISVTGLQPSGNYSLVGHTHQISEVSGLQNALDNKQPSGSYAALVHTHTSNQITDFNSGVSGLLPVKNIISGSGIGITSSSGDFTVSVTGTFGLTGEQVDDRVNSLVSGVYAPLNSPNFSGVPTAPTATSGTNDTQIANTSFVRNEISNLVNSAPSTLDTLNELATALGNDPNFATTIASGLAQKSNVGHSHTSSDIIDFNSGVSGLLPVKNITGSTYANVTSSSGSFNIAITGLQPSGNYANAVHSHIASDITDFNSSVSGLLPITGLSANSGIIVSNSGTIYTLSSSGLAYTSGANFNSLSVTGVPVSVSGHQHLYSDISNWGSGIDQSVNTLLVAGSYVNLNYNTNDNTLTVSVTGVQPSGSYALSSHVHGNISNSGTIGSTSGLLVTTTTSGLLTTSSTITSAYISDFNSSVSGLLPVKNVIGSGYINVNSSSGSYTISTSGLQPSGNYSLAGHSHTTSDITNFNSGVSGLLPSISGSNYIYSNFQNNIYTIGVSGLQPSGNYANTTHTHLSSNITDFNSSVSGLLPITNIIGGSNINVASSGSIYTIGLSGQLGLTAEDVDDRVSTLLVAGTGIDLTYDDNNNALVITSVGSSPSGNYSLVGHSHTSSNITNFNSSVSGLLPVTNIIGGTNISVVPSGTEFTVNVSGNLGLTTEEVDDRVSNLLVAGSGINISYDDNNNLLTITALKNEVRSDVVGNTNYIGKAVQGSPESSSVWTIIRTVYSSNGNVSTNTSATNVKWTDRLTVVYS